jgi:hypothetical protein
MPIRPEMKKRYPKNWPAISLRIRKERAKDQCEWCDDGVRCQAMNGQPHPLTGSKVVLTVAHIHDHRPEACDDDNLLALCQLHHNRHDAPMRTAGKRFRKHTAHMDDLIDEAPPLMRAWEHKS